MTNYTENNTTPEVWDLPDYPWGQDINRDIYKVEYDRQKNKERTFAELGLRLPPDHQHSTELAGYMRQLPGYKQSLNTPNTGLNEVANNATNDSSLMNSSIDNNLLKRAENKLMQGRPRIDPSRFELSDHLDRFIRKQENFVDTVYNDTAGNPTIGIGHKVIGNEFKEGDKITRERAEILYAKDKEKARQYALKLLGGLPMYRYEFEAIVDAMFNVGPGNLGLGTNKCPDLNAAIKARDYDAIGRNLMYSLDSNGKRQEALYNRSLDRTDHYHGKYKDY
ncbi:MAG: lysozyme [Kordiimonadaceae bacterium]|nr:lysozyme [Kordiimonadaceae bacterium]